MASKLYRHWKVKRKTCRFWLHFSRFPTSLLCLVLFILSRGSCADTEAHAKHFARRGIATAVLFRWRWRTHTGCITAQICCYLLWGDLPLQDVSLKLWRFQVFTETRKRFSYKTQTQTQTHCHQKANAHQPRIHFISARLCNCKEPSVGFSWNTLSFFSPHFFPEALSHLYTTTPIAPVRALHFQNSAALLTVYFIHFGCCEAPNSILPWSTQCIKAHYSIAGVLWFVLLLVLDIKSNVWVCHHLGKMQIWLHFCW